MNQEMNNNNNNNNNMSVTSLLMKTLENATKEYARECIRRCALKYGFSSEEAEVSLNLENCVLQVKEMKKRSGGKAKTVKATKPVKEVKEKAVQIAFPFVEAGIKEEGCEGLAYNSGLFTQCQKIRMSQSSYCKACQHEADGSATGEPTIGTVYGRMAVGMMEFRDGKGRRPIAYRKIMEKNGLSRDRVAEEALKLNITIDEVHFAAVEEKKRSGEKAGRPKTAKKSKVVSAETVEDLFAQLVDEEEGEDDSMTSTVLMSDSEGEEEDKALAQEQKARQSASEKVLRSVEQGMMKEADAEAKKIVKAEQRSAKAEELIIKAQQKEQKAAEDLIIKAQQKEAKAAEDLAAKEQKAAKLITDKLEKEEKMAAELIVKAQLKEAKVAADLAAKELKAAKLIEDKELKAAKVAAELVAKEKKAAEPKKVVEKKVAAKKPEAKKAAAKAVEVKKAEVEAPAVSKKVTVKRITINGKEYLKTVDNLLYDPETREEMGTYDAETNTIKALPDDDDDEIEEDGYDTDAN
jgi:hypothetical protein